MDAQFFCLKDEIDQEKCQIVDHLGKEFCCKYEEYCPEKWRILAEPCYFENRWNANWDHHVYCLVCEKMAGNDHVASNKHRDKIRSNGQQFRDQYRAAITSGKICFPTDGLNRRDRNGSVIPPTEKEEHADAPPPAEKDPNFVPTPLKAPPAGGMNRPGGGGGGTGDVGPICDDVDMMTDEQLQRLMPVDFRGRLIPRDEYEWKGSIDGYQDYIRELYKNPQFYEVFDHNGWPALRCRLCPNITKINSSHTPGSNTHRKNLSCHHPGQKVMEQLPYGQAARDQDKCKNLFPPLRGSDIKEGVHVPHGFRFWGNIKDGCPEPEEELGTASSFRASQSQSNYMSSAASVASFSSRATSMAPPASSSGYGNSYNSKPEGYTMQNEDARNVQLRAELEKKDEELKETHAKLEMKDREMVKLQARVMSSEMIIEKKEKELVDKDFEMEDKLKDLERDLTNLLLCADPNKIYEKFNPSQLTSIRDVFIDAVKIHEQMQNKEDITGRLPQSPSTGSGEKGYNHAQPPLQTPSTATGSPPPTLLKTADDYDKDSYRSKDKFSKWGDLDRDRFSTWKDQDDDKFGTWRNRDEQKWNKWDSEDLKSSSSKTTSKALGASSSSSSSSSASASPPSPAGNEREPEPAPEMPNENASWDANENAIEKPEQEEREMNDNWTWNSWGDRDWKGWGREDYDDWWKNEKEK